MEAVVGFIPVSSLIWQVLPPLFFFQKDLAFYPPHLNNNAFYTLLFSTGILHWSVGVLGSAQYLKYESAPG